MRFTSSQTSFKSGRLSPKLAARIDTKQYGDGASIMSGMRIMPEGGAERMRGYRALNDEVSRLPTGTDVKTISFTVNNAPFAITFDTWSPSANNWQTDAFVYPYPYGADSSSTITIIEGFVTAGTTKYSAEGFGIAVYDGKLIVVHDSGTFHPHVMSFSKTTNGMTSTSPLIKTNSTGTYKNANNTLGGWIDFDLSYNFLSPKNLPMSDVGKITSPLTLGSWNATNKTLNITSPDASVVAILKRSAIIYCEGLGKLLLTGVTQQMSTVCSMFYTVTDSTSLANGVVVTPWEHYKFDNTNAADMLIHGGVTTVQDWAYPLWWNGNYPKTVTAYESRLVFGGTPDAPLTLFGSKVGTINQFCQIRRPYPGHEVVTIGILSGSTLPTDPYLFTLAADTDSRITFLKPSSALVIGTDKKEFVAGGGESILSALAVDIKPVTSQGSYPQSAISTGSGVYFLSADRKRLMRFKYSGKNGSFVSEDLSLLFSDLLEGDKIKTVVWAAYLSSVMVLMDSGKLYGLVDHESTDSMAFYDTGLTDVKTIAAISPNPTDFGEANRGEHLIGLIGTNGLCLMEQQFMETSTLPEEYFVDDAISDANAHLFLNKVINIEQVSTGVGTYRWDFNHFTGDRTEAFSTDFYVPTYLYPVGSTVYIINQSKLDTDPQPVVTYTIPAPFFTDAVTGVDVLGTKDLVFQYSKITDPTVQGWLAEGDTKIIVGTAATPVKLATMNVEAGQQWGTAQMGIKNIDTIGIRHYKTYSYEISSDNTNWQEVVVASDTGECTTGRKETKYSTSPDTDQIIYIRNTKPEPLTILGINMRGVSNDG